MIQDKKRYYFKRSCGDPCEISVYLNKDVSINQKVAIPPSKEPEPEWPTNIPETFNSSFCGSDTLKITVPEGYMIQIRYDCFWVHHNRHSLNDVEITTDVNRAIDERSTDIDLIVSYNGYVCTKVYTIHVVQGKNLIIEEFMTKAADTMVFPSEGGTKEISVQEYCDGYNLKSFISGNCDSEGFSIEMKDNSCIITADINKTFSKRSGKVSFSYYTIKQVDGNYGNQETRYFDLNLEQEKYEWNGVPTYGCDEIVYTTKSGKIKDWGSVEYNVELLFNTYINGIGVMKFNGCLTEIGDGFDGDDVKTITFPSTLERCGLNFMTAYRPYGQYDAEKITVLDLSNTKLEYIKGGLTSTNILSLKLPDCYVGYKEPEPSYMDYSYSLFHKVGSFYIDGYIDVDFSNTKLKYINSFSFNSYDIKSIKLPSTVEYIGDKVFENAIFNNEGTFNIDLSNLVNLTYIGDNFMYRTYEHMYGDENFESLIRVKLPDNIREVGYGFLSNGSDNNSDISGVTRRLYIENIPKSLETVGSNFLKNVFNDEIDLRDTNLRYVKGSFLCQMMNLKKVYLPKHPITLDLDGIRDNMLFSVLYKNKQLTEIVAPSNESYNITDYVPNYSNVLRYSLTGNAEKGYLYYPEGSDYSAWCERLPLGWECIPSKDIDNPKPPEIDVTKPVIMYKTTDNEPITIKTDSLVSEYFENGYWNVLLNESFNGIITRDFGFYSNRDVTEVRLNNRVTVLGENAFSSCSSITIFDAPSVTTIQAGCFQYCGKFEEFNFPNLKEIGDNGLGGLKTIDFPLLETIGRNVFDGFDGTTVNLPSLKEVGDYALSGSWALATLSLPMAENIGYHALSACSSLTSVDLPSVKKIEDGALANMADNAVIRLGDSIEGTFLNCFGEGRREVYCYNKKSPDVWGGMYLSSSWLQKTYLTLHVYPDATGYEKWTDAWGKSYASHLTILYDL